MERRTFFKALVAITVAPNYFVSNPVIRTAAAKLYPGLYGIPYHQSNASMGAWLGIPRDMRVYNELSSLVQKIEEIKCLKH